MNGVDVGRFWRDERIWPQQFALRMRNDERYGDAGDTPTERIAIAMGWPGLRDWKNRPRRDFRYSWRVGFLDANMHWDTVQFFRASRGMELEAKEDAK